MHAETEWAKVETRTWNPSGLKIEKKISELSSLGAHNLLSEVSRHGKA
jgi:hypothetical protein